MPFPVLTAATQANCPHQIPITFAATASKVLVAGSPPMLDGDLATVGPTCPFTVPTGKPQPCVTAKLTLTAAKVTSQGRALVLQSPGDICESAEKIPQGPVVYVNVQTKVIAS
jgi:hypothetical protein